jgi:hypothetical protein
VAVPSPLMKQNPARKKRMTVPSLIAGNSQVSHLPLLYCNYRHIGKPNNKKTSMTNDMIEKFIQDKKHKNLKVNIHFKQRGTVTGLFIQTSDYSELKGKNLWRIVSASKVEEWQKTKDINLARIFNGTEFTRLSNEDAG